MKFHPDYPWLILHISYILWMEEILHHWMVETCWNPRNNGINHLSTAGFRNHPQYVVHILPFLGAFLEARFPWKLPWLRSRMRAQELVKLCPEGHHISPIYIHIAIVLHSLHYFLCIYAMYVTQTHIFIYIYLHTHIYIYKASASRGTSLVIAFVGKHGVSIFLFWNNFTKPLQADLADL